MREKSREPPPSPMHIDLCEFPAGRNSVLFLYLPAQAFITIFKVRLYSFVIEVYHLSCYLLGWGDRGEELGRMTQGKNTVKYTYVRKIKDWI